jgi:predicted GIY-YIG superfamily endonuclease
MDRFKYVYVLRSLQDGTFYVGLTEDLKRRFHQQSDRPSAFDQGAGAVGADLL